jgi:hypothetical protein
LALLSHELCRCCGISDLGEEDPSAYGQIGRCDVAVDIEKALSGWANRNYSAGQIKQAANAGGCVAIDMLDGYPVDGVVRAILPKKNDYFANKLDHACLHPPKA